MGYLGGSHLVIRPMSAETVEHVARIEQLCFSDPWSLASLTSELSNPRGVFLIAELDEVVIGYAGMHHILDEGYITNIAVLPDYRRKGLARSLLESLLSYAAEHEMAFLTLEVRASNAAAQALYEGVGFNYAGTRRGYYANPREDALLMTLTLP